MKKWLSGVSFNWVDLAPFAPTTKCKDVKLFKLRQAILWKDKLVIDTFARLRHDTLFPDKLLYVAGEIGGLALSKAVGWGLVEVVTPPGEYGIGQYVLDGVPFYAIEAPHPSSAMMARGKGSARRYLERSFRIMKGFNEMKSSRGDAPSVPEIDDYLSKHLKAEDKAQVEESRAIRALLNIDGDRWPSKMRVLRTLDLAGGECRRKIEFLMSEDGGGVF